jgi:hypothetical protein
VSFATGQHYLLKARSGEVWDIYRENQTLLYKFFLPGYHFPPTPVVLVDLPVLEYSAVIDSSDNIHLVCITKSGELKYFVGKPGSIMNSTVLAEFDMKLQNLNHLTLLLTAKRVHIFHLITSTVNSFVWAIMHSFWNGREWKDQQIGEIIAGRKVPPYSVDKDSQENIHLIFTSAHGGKFFEAHYKKFNKMYDLWSHTERISNLPDNTPEVFGLIDNNDNLHLIACGLSNKDNKLKISCSRRKDASKNTARWEPAINIHSPKQGAARPLLSCRDNTIYGFWREQSGYMSSKSEDSGSSWSLPESVSLAGKSVLLSYSSNFQPEAGRWKIPLIPGTVDITARLALYEDFQPIPPPKLPEKTVISVLPPEEVKVEREQSQAESAVNFAAGADIFSPAIVDEIEEEQGAAGKDEKEEQAVYITAVEGAAGAEVNSNGKDEMETLQRLSMEIKIQVQSQIEDLKMDDQLICLTVEKVEEKLHSLENSLADINKLLERSKEQQDEIISIMPDSIKAALQEDEKTKYLESELQTVKIFQGDINQSLERLREQQNEIISTIPYNINTAFQENEKIQYLESELQAVKNHQADMERSVTDVGKKNRQVKDFLGELEKTRILLSGELVTLSERFDNLQGICSGLTKEQEEAGQLVGKLYSDQKMVEADIEKIFLTGGAISEVIEKEIKVKIESLDKELMDSRLRVEEIAGQFNNEIKLLTVGLSSQRDIIANMGDRLEQYAGTQAGMHLQWEGFIEELSVMRREQEGFRQSRDALLSREEKLAGLCKGRQNELKKLDDAQEKLKTGLELAGEERGRLQSEQKVMQDALKGIRKELDSISLQNSSCREEQARIREEKLQKIMSGLAELKEQGEALINQVNAIQSKQLENKQHIASLESNHKELLKKINAIEEEQRLLQEEQRKMINRGFLERLFSG